MKFLNFQRPVTSELLRWCLAFAAIAYAADVVSLSHAPNPIAPAALAASLFGAGAFNIAAWIMILARAAQPLPTPPAPGRAILLTLLFGLLCALPLGLALVPALLALGLTLCLAPALPRGWREIGLLLLALGASWASAFARFLHVAIGKHLDAPIATALSRLTGTPAQVTGNLITSRNFSIEILPACASSTPLPTVLLAYLVVILYQRRRLTKQDIPFALASLAVSIVLTWARLTLMIPSHAAWNYWHNGQGLTYYELAALTSALVFPWFAGTPHHPAPAPA